MRDMFRVLNDGGVTTRDVIVVLVSARLGCVDARRVRLLVTARIINATNELLQCVDSWWRPLEHRCWTVSYGMAGV